MTFKKKLRKQGKMLSRELRLSYKCDVIFQQQALIEVLDLKIPTFEDWIKTIEVPKRHAKVLYKFHVLRLEDRILIRIEDKIKENAKKYTYNI